MNRPPAMAGLVIGHVDMLRARRARLAAAAPPRLAARIMGQAPPREPEPPEPPPPRPVGRSPYRPAGEIMLVVARCADLSVDGLRGSRQDCRLVDARCVVAVLALEFCPRSSVAAIDDATCRGRGYTRWARERHADRRALYRHYGTLFDRCRDELLR